MNGGSRIAGAVAAALLLTLLPGGASALAAGGPPPPEIHGFCFKELKPCGEPVVLGEPTWKTGSVTAYGFSSRIGPCIGYEQSDGGSGSCGGNGPPLDGSPILLSGFGRSLTDGRVDYTEIDGLLRADVAGVRLRYVRDGRTHRLDAFVAQISGATQRKLKAPEPFGIVEATLPGCVRTSSFRATAFDASGRPLGSTRGPRFGGECHRRRHDHRRSYESDGAGRFRFTSPVAP